MPEMDISAAADEVVALLRQNGARGAAARLEALHNGQRGPLPLAALTVRAQASG